MTTLLFLFVFVLIFSMDLTPAATWLGARLVAVDIPMERLPRLQAGVCQGIGGTLDTIVGTVKRTLTQHS